MLQHLLTKGPASIPSEADAAFENSFNYRPNDVVIASYPKSGSTWLRFMLAALTSDDPLRVDFLAAHLKAPELSSTTEHHGIDFDALCGRALHRAGYGQTMNLSEVA